MDWTEIKNANATELQRRLNELREQLRDLRFRVAAGSHKDVRDIRETRQQIARVMTRLKQVTNKPSTAK